MPRAKKGQTTAASTPDADATANGTATEAGATATAAGSVAATEAEATTTAPPIDAEPVAKPAGKKRPIALKCSVNQAQLKGALDQVRGSLPTRKSLPNPAIGLYRLVADRTGKTLAITTYNEVVATTVTIPANVVVGGELLVSKDLAELVAQLPDAGITLSAETPNRLQVIMDSRTFSPNSMSAANYPDLFDQDGAAGLDSDGAAGLDGDGERHAYQVGTEVFRNALEFVCPGALTEGGDAETSIFNSVRLDLWHGKKIDVFALAASDDSLMVADESTVVADATIDRKSPRMTVAIPVKSLQILAKLLDEAESETVAIRFQSAADADHATLCRFQCGGRELLTHLVTSQWPDYLSHIPTAEQFQSQVVADRELLLSLVNCNLVFAVAKTFRTMIVDPFSQDGTISTWVKTQSKGESVQEMVATISALNGGNLANMKPMGFNAAQVKLALGLFSDTEISWQLISPVAPTLLSAGTKGRWVVLMPISVNDSESESDGDALPEPAEPTTRKGKK